MSEVAENTTYYKSVLPELIENTEAMVENNLEIISKKISVFLPDNKLKLALESRRLAVEDVIWASKEVDRMRFELEGIEGEDDERFLEQSFYRRYIPRIIKELKGMIDNSLEIVSKEITGLSDDKLKQALLSRRMGIVDSVWASKQVDLLEKDLTGKSKKEEQTVEIKNWTKHKATS